jgi:hypothetical protein
MKSKVLFIFSWMFLLWSCNQNTQQHNNIVVPEDILNQGISEVTDQAMQKIIDNISSPIEVAALIKKVGIPFDKSLLASTKYLSNYNTSFQKSTALGVFGADLGYLNMYNKTGTVMENLSTIRDLSDDLKIGQFFDFTTLKRLASNKSDLDSLMFISVHSFNQMDKYLRENKRGNLSALMISGVWLEGLYLVTQVVKQYPDKQLIEKVGEQKIILDNLMLILKNYSNDVKFNEYIAEIEKVRAEFSKVKIYFEMGEPEAIEQDGKLTIIQHETSNVIISDETLKKIITVTEEVRNKLIKI